MYVPYRGEIGWFNVGEGGPPGKAKRQGRYLGGKGSNRAERSDTSKTFEMAGGCLYLRAGKVRGVDKIQGKKKGFCIEGGKPDSDNITDGKAMSYNVFKNSSVGVRLRKKKKKALLGTTFL